MLCATMEKNEKRRMMYEEGASDVCVAMAIADKVNTQCYGKRK